MVHLITGGSGYLGVAVARKLIERGDEVRVYDLAPSDRLPESVEFLEGDVRDVEGLGSAVNGCDVIHHLVGIMPQFRAPKETMRAVNVGGMENVLRAASAANVKRVVFVSSSEVYGRPRFIPIRETDPLEPIGEYGRNKVAAEDVCRKYSGATSLEVVILRPPTIAGPEMNEPTFLRNMEMARRGHFFCVGRGDHRFQMIHVDDAAEACVRASRKDGIDGEAFNIGAEGTLPFRRQLEEIAQHLGKTPRVRSIPTALFKLVTKILRPIGLSPLEPDHLHLLYADFVMDVSKAKEKLGWVPVKTDLQTLIDTYDWYESTRSKCSYEG
jgi:nucleoside-diphosphate-sugar epimerase